MTHPWLVGAVLVLFVVGIVLIAIYVPRLDKYENVDNGLMYLEENNQIGKPTGVLDYLPNQSSCDTPYNLLVQPDVAFKPTRRGTGCTYVQLRYPG